MNDPLQAKVYGHNWAEIELQYHRMTRAEVFDAMNQLIATYLEMHRQYLLAGGDKSDPIR